MQPFTSSAARAAQADPSTIDFAVMPSWQSLQDPEVDPYSRMRMPLLPDNYLARNAPEVSDAPLPMPEISVIAAHPEDVATISALTEVEGMGVDGVELRFAHDAPAPEPEPGMLTDLWKGLVEDVFGESKHKGKLSM
jgi:hypothetical protein